MIPVPTRHAPAIPLHAAARAASRVTYPVEPGAVIFPRTGGDLVLAPTCVLDPVQALLAHARASAAGAPFRPERAAAATS